MVLFKIVLSLFSKNYFRPRKLLPLAGGGWEGVKIVQAEQKSTLSFRFDQIKQAQPIISVYPKYNAQHFAIYSASALTHCAIFPPAYRARRFALPAHALAAALIRRGLSICLGRQDSYYKRR
jgi:hypothetical protein